MTAAVTIEYDWLRPRVLLPWKAAVMPAVRTKVRGGVMTAAVTIYYDFVLVLVFLSWKAVVMTSSKDVMTRVEDKGERQGHGCCCDY